MGADKNAEASSSQGNQDAATTPSTPSSASSASKSTTDDPEQAAAGWNWESKKVRKETLYKGVTGTDAAKNAAGGVYGFELGKVERVSKRAIVLRLEPLNPGLPEFERVLSE